MLYKFAVKVWNRLKKEVLNSRIHLIFSKRESMEKNGERIFIDADHVDYGSFDMYQKNHFKRYEFAIKLINNNDETADFACGTGYGSVLMSRSAKNVTACDIDRSTVRKISKKYSAISNLTFICENLLNLKYNAVFDKLVSFETIEHLEEHNILPLFRVFSNALKQKGTFIFSVPYMQEASKDALKLGHHKTFYINEEKIKNWLENSGFELSRIYYQNYTEHEIMENLGTKDFIIGIAVKK